MHAETEVPKLPPISILCSDQEATAVALTTKSAAILLDCSTATIDRLIKAGELEVLFIRGAKRVTKRSIENFLNTNVRRRVCA